MWTCLADYGAAVGDVNRARERRAKALRARLNADGALADARGRDALVAAAEAYAAALEGGSPPVPPPQLRTAALLLRSVAARLADATALPEDDRHAAAAAAAALAARLDARADADGEAPPDAAP